MGVKVAAPGLKTGTLGLKDGPAAEKLNELVLGENSGPVFSLCDFGIDAPDGI